MKKKMKRWIIIGIIAIIIIGSLSYVIISSNKPNNENRLVKNVGKFDIFANGEIYKCYGKDLYSYCESESGKTSYYGELT